MRRAAAGVLAVVVLLTGCTGTDTEAGPADGDAGEAASASPSEDAPTQSPTGTPSASPSAPPEVAEDPLPRVRNRLSLPALMREDWRAGRIRETSVEVVTDTYTRSRVTYRSGDLTISGVLLRPPGRGPFPGIVLNHGYIEPSIYAPGQGLAREQEYLVNQGFVVLHTDYRGHAGSDPPVGPFDRESRLGYTRDAINAVLALEREPYVDPDRMAMLGRSMGGGVTLNALVAYPDLVEAAVVYASVSSDLAENIRHFTDPNRPDVSQSIYTEFGTPRENPRFYRDLSARTYFDRVSDPVLLHHGTVDGTCPPQWARDTQRLLDRAGADARTTWWEGEDHTFYAAWEASMEQTVRFVRRQF